MQRLHLFPHLPENRTLFAGRRHADARHMSRIPSAPLSLPLPTRNPAILSPHLLPVPGTIN